MINKKLYNGLEKYRKNFAESNLNTVSIVCFDYEIETAVKVFQDKFGAKIERILISHYFPRKNDISEYENIPVESLEYNYDKNNLAVYIDFYEMVDNHWIATMNMIAQNRKGLYYFFTPADYKNGCMLTFPPLKSFYEAHKQEIDKVYSLLSSKKSKKVFLQRLKSLTEGDAGYLAYNGEMDYFPQELMPTVKKGAVIVDAGISSSIFEFEKYTELIGEKGKIFAFEASPIECEKAKNIIATKPLLKNIELLCLGLWNKHEKLQMAVGNGGSSVLYPINGDAVECELVALDDFVKDNKINKLDYIKMDIESAEPNALRGAQKTIKKFKPDMAICIYHAPSHLWDIALYLNSLNIGYNFYIHHHSSTCCETVLYAVRPVFIKRVFNIVRNFLYDIWHLRIGKTSEKGINSIELKNKRVVVYGAGKHFESLLQNGVFKNINVVALSDRKFEKTSEYKGYTAIPPNEILNYKPDIIYIAMQEGMVAHAFLTEMFKEKMQKIKFINV